MNEQKYMDLEVTFKGTIPVLPFPFQMTSSYLEVDKAGLRNRT